MLKTLANIVTPKGQHICQTLTVVKFTLNIRQVLVTRVERPNVCIASFDE